MAHTIRAAFHGVAEVRRDLESVRLGLGKELTAVLRGEGDPVARETAVLTPTGPGPQSAKDNLPHVAATISGAALPNGVAVVATHPAAPVLEFGGSISPRGHLIRFPSHAMAHKAGEAALPRIEAAVTRRIDALLIAHGLA